MQTSIPDYNSSSGRVAVIKEPASSPPPTHTWVGRSAEELLHKHAREPGAEPSAKRHAFLELQGIHKNGNVLLDLHSGAIEVLREPAFEPVLEGHDPSTIGFERDDEVLWDAFLKDVAALIKLFDAPIVVEARVRRSSWSDGTSEEVTADRHVELVKQRLHSFCADYNFLHSASRVEEEGPDSEILFYFDSYTPLPGEGGEPGAFWKRKGPLPISVEHLGDVVASVAEVQRRGKVQVDLNSGFLKPMKCITFLPLGRNADPKSVQFEDEEGLQAMFEDVAELVMSLDVPVEIHGHTVSHAPKKKTETKEEKASDEMETQEMRRQATMSNSAAVEAAKRLSSAAETRARKVLGCLLDLGVAPELALSVVEDDGMEAPHDGFWRTEEADIVQLSNGSVRDPFGQRLPAVDSVSPGGKSKLVIELGGKEMRGDLRGAKQILLWDDGTSWVREQVTIHMDLLQCRCLDAPGSSFSSGPASAAPRRLSNASGGSSRSAPEKKKGAAYSLPGAFSESAKASAKRRSPAASAALSAAALRPLGAPAPLQSPFAELTQKLQRMPREFERQREAEAQRNARKLLRQSYRIACEALGHEWFVENPWPARAPKPSGAAEAVDPAETRATYLRAPFSMTPAPYPLNEVTQVAPKARSPGTVGAPASVDALARPPGATSRKEAIAKLKELGRGAFGSPYTFGQVFHEIDCDVHHRRARDTRVIAGKLGPLQLGPGTSRARRGLPFSLSAVSASSPSLRSEEPKVKSLGN